MASCCSIDFLKVQAFDEHTFPAQRIPVCNFSVVKAVGGSWIRSLSREGGTLLLRKPEEGVNP